MKLPRGRVHVNPPHAHNDNCWMPLSFPIAPSEIPMVPLKLDQVENLRRLRSEFNRSKLPLFLFASRGRNSENVSFSGQPLIEALTAAEIASHKESHIVLN